ncbi:MAG TPA: SOS response-associated peptidase [Longimicrobiales bacterium]|nr:SOS response-associated peptidase [Longimicrobiales bacterium]
MCGRYSLATPPDELVEVFEVDHAALGDWIPRYNIAPTQSAPVILADGEGRRRLGSMQWGLVPFWADDPSIGNRMINARSESAAGKPAFKEAWARRRCVVPADGFYEWRAAPGGGPKTPFWIHRSDGVPLALAGLWERWRQPDGGRLHTFTILTRRASPWMAPLHDRMPVLLAPDQVQPWLTFAGALPDPSDPALEAVEVSRLVNAPANDEPGCVEPLAGGERIPPEGSAGPEGGGGAE